MNQREGLLEVVDRTIALLDTPDTKRYFSSEIEWLETRRDIWTKRNWRIGLIGVTSLDSHGGSRS